MKSRVLSLRLRTEQMERLQRLARRADRKPSELAARLIEEALRMAEFPAIEFRDTIVGRQAYIKGSRIAPWFLEVLARANDRDIERVAAHLHWPTARVRAGLAYAEAFPEEIASAIAEQEAYDDEATLLQAFPEVQIFDARAAGLRDEVGPEATENAAPAAR